MVFALVTALLVLIVGGAVLKFVAAKLRGPAVRRWARGRGWSYNKHETAIAHSFRGWPFMPDKNLEARNVVQGRIDIRRIGAFDLLSVGSFVNVLPYGVVFVSLPASLPRLQVTRERLRTRLGRETGVHDIELENQAFNSRFRIRCEDRKLAYDVLNPRAMEYLMGAKCPSWRIEGAVLVSWERGMLRPDRIERRIEFLFGLIGQIPSFVWDNAEKQR